VKKNCRFRHHDLRGKEMSYSDGSEAPKTEGGLPARLFRNYFSPLKYEEAGRDACTTLSIHLIAFRSHPLSLSPTFLPKDFRMSEILDLRLQNEEKSGETSLLL